MAAGGGRPRWWADMGCWGGLEDSVELGDVLWWFRDVRDDGRDAEESVGRSWTGV
jgi:hypothetical protein